MKSLRALVATILILFFLPEAFAQNEFSTFWKKFRFAVIAGDKTVLGNDENFPAVDALFGKGRKARAGTAPL